MMRSGEHALWDAHLVRGYALSERSVLLSISVDMAALNRQLTKVAKALGRTARDVSRQMAATVRAIEEAQPTAEEVLAGWRAARPQNAPTKEDQ